MAYQETAISSPTQLIDSIAAFGESVGFVKTFHGVNGAGNRGVTFSGGGLTDYAVIRVDGTTDLHCKRTTTYDSQDQFDGTMQSMRGLTNLLTAGPYLNAHMFAEANVANPYLYVVLELSAGLFRHFGFGELEKVGVWTGGAFNFGHYVNQSISYRDNPVAFDHMYPFCATNNTGNHSSSIKCAALPALSGTVGANRDPNFTTTYLNANYHGRIANGDFVKGSTNYEGVGYNRYMSGYYDTSPNYFNKRTVLAPITIFGWQTSDYVSILGAPPNMRLANISAYSPKEEFTIASDTYKIFPLSRKGWVDNEEYTYDFALAYKKVA